MKKRVASYGEKRKMESLLYEHSVLVSESDAVAVREFKSGWNFEVIAKTVSPSLNGHHARHVATQLSLDFTPVKRASLEERLADIEAALDSLDDRIRDLERH